MKRNVRIHRLAAAALALALLLALTACGGQSAPAREPKAEEGPSETLKGIFEALTAPGSDYSRNKAAYVEYYPELEYGETLGDDRITLSFSANGNEYFKDGAWEFVEEDGYLTAVIRDGDYNGTFNVLNVGCAVGNYFGLESELVGGYLNGLGALGIESRNFSIAEDAAAGATVYKLNISGPWEMPELDQMVLDEAILGGEALNDEYFSQGGSLGKLRYLCNGNARSCTVLLAEFGGLDDAAYQSIVNLVSLRKPAGWEAFLADFTALTELETEDYSVDLDPDDAAVAEIMGERNDKFSYALLRFGSEDGGETEYEPYVPAAEFFAEFYFRRVAGYHQATAGAGLAEAQCACDVLALAVGNELGLADQETLEANLTAAWESLTDDERAAFDENFLSLYELLEDCFRNWERNRGRFEDAGAAETMDELLADGTSERSWGMLSEFTFSLDREG